MAVFRTYQTSGWMPMRVHEYGGSLFAMGLDTGGGNQLRVRKSSGEIDGTWTEVGGAGRPTINPANNASINGDVPLLHEHRQGDVIRIAYQESATSGHVRYGAFDLASETWTVIDESVTGAAVPVSTGLIRAGVFGRSDGSVVCLFRGPNTSVMGQARATFYYRIRSTGGVWGSSVQVYQAPDAGNPTIVGIIPGNGCEHLLYDTTNNNNFAQRSLTGTTLGTESTLAGGTYRNWEFQDIEMYAPSGNVSYLPVAYEITEGVFKYSATRFTSADPPTIVDNWNTLAATGSQDGVHFASYFDGTTVTLMGQDADASDIITIEAAAAGSTWGSPTIVGTNPLGTLSRVLYSSRYTRSGSARLTLIERAEASPYANWIIEYEASPAASRSQRTRRSMQAVHRASLH